MHGHKALCEIIAHKYKYDSYRVIKEILQSLVKEKISIRNIKHRHLFYHSISRPSSSTISGVTGSSGLCHAHSS